MKKFILILSLGLALAGATLAESRTWTQAGTGKTLSGELTEVRADKARIKMENNKVLDLPIAMLSEEDKTFIKNWQAARAGGGTVSSKPVLEPLPKTGPVEVTLGNIHLCCKGCRDAVTNSAGSLNGVTVEMGDTVVLKAVSDDLARGAYAALINAGFYGDTKFDMGTSAPAISTTKVSTLKIEGYHNCCGRCNSAIEDALNVVEGVKSVDVQKTGATIQGDFSPADILASLQKAGVSARIVQ